MNDISKCAGLDCAIKETCKRHKLSSTPSIHKITHELIEKDKNSKL